MSISSRRLAAGVLAAGLVAGCASPKPPRQFDGPTALIKIDTTAGWSTSLSQVDLAQCPAPSSQLLASFGASGMELVGVLIKGVGTVGPLRTGETRVDAGRPLNLQVTLGNDNCAIFYRFTPAPDGVYQLTVEQLAKACQVKFRRLVNGQPEFDTTAQQIPHITHPRELCD